MRDRIELQLARCSASADDATSDATMKPMSRVQRALASAGRDAARRPQSPR